MQKNTKIMTIAGFDPSGGAGILSDIKTFEANNVNSIGVCTCITIQNEKKVEKIYWLPFHQIKEQINISFSANRIDFVKIGLIENFQILYKIILLLIKLNPNIKIIWDPILKSSSGFIFHKKINKELFYKIIKEIFLLTPNFNEWKLLTGESEIVSNNFISVKEKNKIKCHVLLKGGHREGYYSEDKLLFNNKIYTFRKKRIKKVFMHGTGCILSATILSNLCKGIDLPHSCKLAQKWVFLQLKSLTKADIKKN